MRTFYDILGISRSASQQEILVAYRKRCLETHPDKGGDGKDFMNVRKGYEILSNPEKRRTYDQWVLRKEKEELERKIKEQRTQNEEFSHKNTTGSYRKQNTAGNNENRNNSKCTNTTVNNEKSEKTDHLSFLIIGILIILFTFIVYFINSNNNTPDKPLQYKEQSPIITSEKIIIKDIKWLYNELSKHSDIGSYSNFKEELKDSIMARYYYRDACIRGIEIGSFEDFNKMLLKERIIDKPFKMSEKIDESNTSYKVLKRYGI